MQIDGENGKVRLSIRETQILRLLCSEGLQTKEIAVRLRLSANTIAGYVDELLGGLRLGSKNVLIVWGMQHPEAIQGEWTDPKMHKPGCLCGRALCAILDEAA